MQFHLDTTHALKKKQHECYGLEIVNNVLRPHKQSRLFDVLGDDNAVIASENKCGIIIWHRIVDNYPLYFLLLLTAWTVISEKKE